MARTNSAALVLLGLVSVSAGATPEGPAANGGPEDQRYRVTATVLEDDAHGPQLCSWVFASDPPRCGGLDVVGWEWSKVEAESRGGVTWGHYTLVGTYDGERFTLTEPATRPSDSPPSPEDDVTFDTACPEPEGGWRAVAKSKYKDAQGAVIRRVRSDPDFVGMWISRPGRTYVLNVSFTGHLARHEESIREVWGGALCVSQAKYARRELSRIAKELRERHRGEVLDSNVDEYANRVKLELYVATDELQAELDAKYGAGAVRLTGWFEPVE